MKILNLTLNPTDLKMRRAGVVDMNDEDKRKVKNFLIFKRPPTYREIVERSLRLLEVVEESGKECVLIEGPSYLTSTLHQILVNNEFKVAYPFYLNSTREGGPRKDFQGFVKTW